MQDFLLDETHQQKLHQKRKKPSLYQQSYQHQVGYTKQCPAIVKRRAWKSGGTTFKGLWLLQRLLFGVGILLILLPLYAFRSDKKKQFLPIFAVSNHFSNLPFFSHNLFPSYFFFLYRLFSE